MYSSFNARAVGLADLPINATIDIAAAAGFDAVDLMIRDIVLSGTDLNEVQTRLTDRGLRAGAFPMTMNWRGDSAVFERDLADLPRFVEAATRLGCTRTGTWVLPETQTMPEAGENLTTFRSKVAAWHVERIGAIARVLAQFDVQLGLEVIGVESFRTGRGLPFVTRMNDLEPTLTRLLSEPNVGLLVDVWHLYAAGEPLEVGLKWGVERIVWAHLADLPDGLPIDRKHILDAERGLPDSRGVIDCQGFLRLLQQAGYHGPITVEPLGQCSSLLGQDPAEVALRVKRALDSCWPTGA